MWFWEVLRTHSKQAMSAHGSETAEQRSSATVLATQRPPTPLGRLSLWASGTVRQNGVGNRCSSPTHTVVTTSKGGGAQPITTLPYRSC